MKNLTIIGIVASVLGFSVYSYNRVEESMVDSLKEKNNQLQADVNTAKEENKKTMATNALLIEAIKEMHPDQAEAKIKAIEEAAAKQTATEQKPEEKIEQKDQKIEEKAEQKNEKPIE